MKDDSDWCALLRDDGRSTLIVEYGDYYSEK